MIWPLWWEWDPSKHNTSTQCWYNVGPLSTGPNLVFYPRTMKEFLRLPHGEIGQFKFGCGIPYFGGFFSGMSYHMYVTVQTKEQYLLTLQVSRYGILHLHGSMLY